MGDVATFVTFNRIRPAASHEGSFPRTCDSVDWPRFLDPDLARQGSRQGQRGARVSGQGSHPDTTGSAAASLADHEEPNSSGSVMHFSPRTRNADHQARIGAPSARAAPGSPAILRHAELLSPRAPFLFPNACTTTLLPRQRIRLALRWVQPARIRVRPALRSRGVRTPLPLSAARTRPGGSCEAARRPDGTTSMGRERVPGRGLGDRRHRTRSRGGQPAASSGGMSLDTEETAGSPTKRSGGRNNAIKEATSRINPLTSKNSPPIGPTTESNALSNQIYFSELTMANKS